MTRRTHPLKTHWTLGTDQDRSICGRVKSRNEMETSSVVDQVTCLRCLKLAVEQDVPRTVYGVQLGVLYRSIGARIDAVLEERQR